MPEGLFLLRGRLDLLIFDFCFFCSCWQLGSQIHTPFGLVRVRFCPSASLGVSVFGQGRDRPRFMDALLPRFVRRYTGRSGTMPRRPVSVCLTGAGGVSPLHGECMAKTATGAPSPWTRHASPLLTRAATLHARASPDSPHAGLASRGIVPFARLPTREAWGEPSRRPLERLHRRWPCSPIVRAVGPLGSGRNRRSA